MLPCATSPPCNFTQGDSVAFTVGAEGYPSSAWTLKFIVISQTGQIAAQVTAAADADNISFDVALTTTQTAAIAPGRYNWRYVLTEGSQRVTVNSVRATEIFVAPDPLQNLPQTPEMIRLASVQTALAKLAANPLTSTSVDGQTWTQGNIASYRDEEDRLQVIVWNQMRKLGLSTNGSAQQIVTQFS